MCDEDLLAFYRFFHEIFEPNDLIHFARFSELACGHRLGREQVWLVRKPTEVHLDEQGRLHSASGMCVRFGDGWGLYAWHGVRVPEKLILHPETLTREDWLEERNLEVLRVMQERLGPERFVDLLGSISIDSGKRGTLIEVDLSDYDLDRVARYVHVTDASTSRQYYLRVPLSIRRADEAVAWTFGLDEQDYQPVQET